MKTETQTDLVVRRTIPASAEELFDAWLDPKSLALWMTPMDGMTPATVRNDPRVGGEYEIIMHAPGHDYPHRGNYRVIDRPRRLAFTWLSDATGDRETVVTVEFVPRGAKTEVVLTHAGLDDDAQTKHTQGWSGVLEKLEKFV
ncbi:MAG: SRPBCC domain-containing protein [Thermoanaerobaculia bacterium]|nr:SRPBCC domain-containing protein [Thermoanaerobaculia bacterium]